MKITKPLFKQTRFYAIGVFSLSLFLLFFPLNIVAQDGRVSIDKKDVTILSVFEEIEKQTGLTIAYNKSIIDVTQRVSVSASNKTVQEVLTQVLKNTGATFLIQGKQVIISQEKAQSTAKAISGTVKDEAGEPIVGAVVLVKGTTAYATSDADGVFKLTVPANKDQMEITSLGYNTIETKVGTQTTFNFVMKESAQTLEEVVITGMFTRNKASFTGSTTMVNAEQLAAVGNQNVIQSLKSLDPAFIVLDNNLLGSDPNALPYIEIRGTTSININNLNDKFAVNPNQPLFILDGFETTLQRINDLDINRIASVTLLKDAASTAIYGSKAANGVVVVETIKPRPGDLQVYYTGDFSVQVPDLTAYDLMNSSEKLEFERLSGRYTSTNPDQQMLLNSLYNEKLSEIKRGVDTYWLSEPLRLGYTIGNSLQVSGGSSEFTYRVGISYKPVYGVMKGSDKQPWGGNIDLDYRKGNFNVKNSLDLSGYTSNESNYGSFADYAKTNPYYRKSTDKYLEESTGIVSGSSYEVINPLYNASLNSKNSSSNFGFVNNLQLNWTIMSGLRADASLQVKKFITESIQFIPPENTVFDHVNIYERGSYHNGQISQSGYQVNASVSYATIFKDKHNLTANLRGEIQEDTYRTLDMEAVGFPPNTNGNPAFAFSYKPDTHPLASTSVRRQVNLIGSINYSYDYRYLLDVSYRYSGSSAFGTERLFSPSYSIGVGWNIHKEHFMESDWLNLLKLRASIGSTGNQNIGTALSNTIFSYYSGLNYFGQGVIVTNLGNPFVEWQKTTQSNISLDFGLFNDLFNGSVSVYEKISEPQQVNIAKPTSTGVLSLSESAGKLITRGFEGVLSSTILKINASQPINKRIVWTVNLSAGLFRDQFADFGNLLNNLNEEEAKNNTLIRYSDGYSQSDIWAVRSLGIDPASGNEVFLTKDGHQTFTYSVDDIVRVGNNNPKVQGVIGTNLTFKGLMVGFRLRYRYGGDMFNTVLFNKVENIGLEALKSNQDKRALYDRWQKPGDVAQFKSIAITSDANTKASSRFVQPDNTLTGESFNIGWIFDSQSWIRHLRMKSFKINFYANNFFYWSTVQAERGINYPFSRTFSMSINASF